MTKYEINVLDGIRFQTVHAAETLEDALDFCRSKIRCCYTEKVFFRDETCTVLEACGLDQNYERVSLFIKTTF